MSGLDIDRLFDQNLAETVQCPICLTILNNPLMTKCGHNCCHQCLKDTVKSEIKECPECRKPFTKKRPKESMDDSCVAIAYNKEIYLFSKNLRLKEIIGKLKITCDYEFNGCKDSVELDSLPKHINECEHKSCKSCGFRLKGSTDDHLCNCIEVIKNERNQLKGKHEKSLEENKKLREEVTELKNDMNDWKLKYEMKVEENRIISEQKLMLTNEKNQLNEKYEKTSEENQKLIIDLIEWKHKYEISAEENGRSEEIKVLNKEKLKLTNENKDLNLKYQNSAKSYSQSFETMRRLNEKLRTIEEMLDKEKKESENRLQENKKLNEEVNGLKNELNVLKVKYEKIFEDNINWRQEKIKLMNEAKNLKLKYESRSKSYSKSLETIKQSNDEYRRVSHIYDKQKEELKNRLQENKKLSEDINRLKNQSIVSKFMYEISVEENRRMNEEKQELMNKIASDQVIHFHSYHDSIGENAMNKCITSGKCDNHLIGLMYENIDENQFSKQYDSIVLMPSKVQYRSLINSTRVHCTRLLSQRPEEIKISMSSSTFAENILVPNAIIKAISIVCKCKFETAEQILKKIAKQ